MKISFADFAAQIGKSTNWCSNYIRRNQLVVEGERPKQTVDLDNEINQAFYIKWKGKIDPNTPLPEPIQEQKPVNHQQPKPQTTSNGTTDTASASEFELNKLKKMREIESKEIEIRLKLLDEKKKMGELIPVDLVKNVVSTHSRSITTSFKDGLERMITVLTSKHKFTLEEVAELRSDMVKVINKGIDTAIDRSKKDLRKIINEFSQSREVGEHG